MRVGGVGLLELPPPKSNRSLAGPSAIIEILRAGEVIGAGGVNVVVVPRIARDAKLEDRSCRHDR
jgi:hypothetical protein